MRVGVVIGRFQPLHLGHQELLKKARGENDWLWVGIGTHPPVRTKRNPLTYPERAKALELFLEPEKSGGVIFERMDDMPISDEEWVQYTKGLVEINFPSGTEYNLYTSPKDFPWYSENFKLPGWNIHQVIPKHIVSASQVREAVFQEGVGLYELYHWIPYVSMHFLEKIRKEVLADD